MKLQARVVSRGSSPEREPMLHPAPAINSGFEELRTVEITPPAGARWTFYVDDLPLPLIDGRWQWTPGFYAGEVTAELRDDGSGRVAARYLLDVSPDPSKLGCDQFHQMLQEVLEEDPALVIGEEPATLLAGAGASMGSRLATLLALARLRTHVPGFLAAVRAAGLQPRKTVRRRRETLPPHRVRRMDVSSVRRLVGEPGFSAWWQSRTNEDEGAAARFQVDVPYAEPHLDGAANRAMVALIRAVRQRVRAVHSELSQMAPDERENSTRTSLSSRNPVRLGLLREFEIALSQVLREEPWTQVTRPELSAAGLNALSADPLYARAYQLSWKALRLGVSESPEDRLWMSPTWEVFERWCFVRVGKALRESLPSLTWRRVTRRAHPSGAEAGWTGRAGDLQIDLLLQPTFLAWNLKERWGLKSISREREPDLMLSWSVAGERGFMLLDAKYRRARQNILEAMESAHIYMDSLRSNGARPRLALLLIPAATGVDWLLESAFHRSHGVGAAVMTGGLPEIVQLMLREAGIPLPDETLEAGAGTSCSSAQASVSREHAG